ncbi:hypothetical protein DN730_18285 [Marinomonas piezotolerans]|uniref:Uncharacterized protein n=1 Tax=Marinomonas piezotolerans TaxID=2213058 RepID=A0A370U4H6_9GAMM|nr:hypothetical protein [Marinomonas piezotolerans]RDL42657.1 hypothetical protein DN730_18285 [Marinomonas piezotolerans]
MKAQSTIGNAASSMKNGVIGIGIATAILFGSSAHADDYSCISVAEKKVAAEAAKLTDDWSDIFTTQAALITAKTECYIDENITKDNAEDKWADIKTDFQEGMKGIHNKFDAQVEKAKATYRDAKDKAKTDEALAKAEEKYDAAMEKISESYKRSVVALKDKLGIDE